MKEEPVQEQQMTLETKLADKVQQARDRWDNERRICKGCLQIIKNKSRYKHQRSKRHLMMVEELNKKHLPMELRAKRQKLKLFYEL
jgi:hypothetical protein